MLIQIEWHESLVYWRVLLPHFNKEKENKILLLPYILPLHINVQIKKHNQMNISAENYNYVQRILKVLSFFFFFGEKRFIN